MCSAQKIMNPITVAAAFVVLLSLCLTSSTHGAQFYTRPQIHPDHPMKCHWPEMLGDHSLRPGERVTIAPQCVRLTCLPNFVVLGSTCPQIEEEASPDLECVEVPGDSALEYPACCPRLKCVQKIVENELQN